MQFRGCSRSCPRYQAQSPLPDIAVLWSRILFEEACTSAIEAIKHMPRLKTLHLEPIAEDSLCPEALFTLGKDIEELCILGRRHLKATNVKAAFGHRRQGFATRGERTPRSCTMSKGPFQRVMLRSACARISCSQECRSLPGSLVGSSASAVPASTHHYSGSTTDQRECWQPEASLSALCVCRPCMQAQQAPCGLLPGHARRDCAGT